MASSWTIKVCAVDLNPWTSKGHGSTDGQTGTWNLQMGLLEHGKIQTDIHYPRQEGNRGERVVLFEAHK